VPRKSVSDFARDALNKSPRPIAWHIVCVMMGMTPLSRLSAAVGVPYRHNVQAAAPVAPVTLDLNGPLNVYERASRDDKAHGNRAARGGYSATSAAPGFAAQVLVEANLTGTDPFAATRGAKAYDARRAPITSLRLVA
jgi:hypothetical protein